MNDLITNKQMFSRAVTTLLWVAVIWVLALALNAFKEGSYIGRGVAAQNIISVSGSGEVYAKPDIATFSFTVNEEAKSVGDAQKAATQKINTAIELIKKAGVDEKDIKTTSYNISPKYEYYYQAVSSMVCSSTYCPPQPVKNPKVIGYEVSQSVEVKVRKIEDAGDLLAVVGPVGVSNISGLTFSIDDEDKLKMEARNKAIEEAKTKAKVLAKQLGVSIVRVVSYNDTSNFPSYYGYGGAMMAKSADVMETAAPAIPAGENKIVSNVTITYEIR